MQMVVRAVWRGHLYLCLSHCCSASSLQGKRLVLWVDAEGSNNKGKGMTQEAAGDAKGKFACGYRGVVGGR